MSELKTSILVDLRGNLSRQARRMTGSMRRFGRGTRREMKAVDRSVVTTSRNVSRLGRQMSGLLSGAAALQALRGVVGLEARLVGLQVQANATNETMAKVKKTVFEVAQAPEIRLNPDNILDAYDTIIQRSGDVDFALENTRNLGLAIRSSGGAGRDIGLIFAEFQAQGLSAAESMQEFTTFFSQGRQGSFLSSDLARLAPRLIKSYGAVGRIGVQAGRELGATIQLISDGSGSAEESVTSFEALIRDLTNSDKLKKLRSLNIQVFDQEALARGEEVLRPINQLMKEILAATGGKATILSKIFGDESARAFKGALTSIKRDGDLRRLDQLMQVVADEAVVIEAAAKNASTAQAALTDLSTSLKIGAETVGTPFIEGAADISHKLGPTGSVVAAGAAGAGALYGTGKLLKHGPSLLKNVGGRAAAPLAGAALAGAGVIAALSAPVLLAGAAALTLGGGGFLLAAQMRKAEKEREAQQAQQTSVPSGTGPAGELRGRIAVELIGDSPLRAKTVTADEGLTIDVDHGPSMASSQ